ncbi:MAG: hypothetical protein AAF502_11145 [Bacteroidota bacterium]
MKAIAFNAHICYFHSAMLNKIFQAIFSDKVLCILIAGLFATSIMCAQGNFQINAGTHLVADDGMIVIDNSHVTIQGNLNAGNSTIKLTGDNDIQLSSNGSTINDLTIDKTSGTKLLLVDETVINGFLDFDGDNNLIDLNGNDLVMGIQGLILDFDNNDFIITGDAGKVIKRNMTNFTFPVGYNENTYNPIALTETGTIDTIGVRCLENTLADGTTGSIVSDAVMASWLLTEDVPGGSSINLTAQWELTDEPPGFDRSDCGFMTYRNGNWDLPVTNMSASNGNSPYSLTEPIDSLGIIAIGGEAMINRIQLACRTFLQGPYSFGTMTDQLRLKSLVPLTEPYSALGYTQQGRGGGETINPSVLSVTGDDAITDWIFLELRDKNNPAAVLETRSALIQKDGDIVDIDGTSEVGFPVLDDDYFIAIRHRNHLGIRTATAQNLSEEFLTFYDFTLGPAQANGTNPMADLGSGVWGMYGGNTTGDTFVRATGPPTINDYSNLLNYLGGPTGIFLDVYTSQDINMDGNVRATGPPTINDYSRLLNILGLPTNIIFGQL